MNQSNPNDLKQLEQMMTNYRKLEAKLADTNLPHPERQVITAALIMLKEFMANKTRDLKRK